MNLLAAPICKGRFLHVLTRFHGFYCVWEASIRRHADLTAIPQGRETLAWVRSDPQALGMSPSELGGWLAPEATA